MSVGAKPAASAMPSPPPQRRGSEDALRAFSRDMSAWETTLGGREKAGAAGRPREEPGPTLKFPNRQVAHLLWPPGRRKCCANSLALVAASVAAAPSETAHSLQPDAAAVPGRTSRPAATSARQQTLLAQTLLTDRNEDARRFPINASGTVLRNAPSSGARRATPLPAPLAPRRAARAVDRVL